MLAKQFFYVSAGLFLLALSYHLGATNAQGQMAQPLDGPHIDSPGGPNGSAWMTGAVGRVFYANGVPHPAPIPGVARVVATAGTGTSAWPYVVMLENGDFYYGTETQWTFFGNTIGSPTGATPKSWGKVKADYRK